MTKELKFLPHLCKNTGKVFVVTVPSASESVASQNVLMKGFI